MAVAPKRRGRDQDRHTRPLPCPVRARGPPQGGRAGAETAGPQPDGRGSGRAMADRADRPHPQERRADQAYVERAVIPELGSWRVRDIEPADVARVVRAYRDRTAKSAKAKAGGRPGARALLGVACAGSRRVCSPTLRLQVVGNQALEFSQQLGGRGVRHLPQVLQNLLRKVRFRHHYPVSSSGGASQRADFRPRRRWMTSIGSRIIRATAATLLQWDDH